MRLTAIEIIKTVGAVKHTSRYEFADSGDVAILLIDGVPYVVSEDITEDDVNDLRADAQQAAYEAGAR